MKKFELSVESGFDILRNMHLQRLDIAVIGSDGAHTGKLGFTINQGGDLRDLAETLRNLAGLLDERHMQPLAAC